MTDLLLEVSALQAAYCRAVDDRDPDLLRSIVADDVETLGADGVPREGAAEFVGLFHRYWARTTAPGLHLVSNVEITGDGDPIEVRALFHAVSQAADGQVVQTWGRYRDHVTRTAHGGLVFAAKRISVVHRR
ncbi:nuclear transport factor 2 family protein [Dactylosporangium sp. NBC_01737]|uniref:nuclear transport factor 2 family protein n=1 Tax=Dactylosporangium sp. NBC_01737 TaxID=2975959 RepID=UPI002E121430|nr:nuclear transport factor 2 family protein [Dactylosporangium sp. NBC_01737]